MSKVYNKHAENFYQCIFALAKTKIVCEIKPVQPMSASDATLECLASSEQENAKPNITEWRIANNPVIPLDNPRFLVTGINTFKSSLSISNLTSTLAGMYECVIEFNAEKNVCSYKLEGDFHFLAINFPPTE